MTATTYKIQKGDTLSHIALAHGLTVKELAKINGIKNPDYIQAGKTLIFEEKLNTVPMQTSTLGMDSFTRTEQDFVSPYAPKDFEIPTYVGAKVDSIPQAKDTNTTAPQTDVAKTNTSIPQENSASANLPLACLVGGATGIALYEGAKATTPKALKVAQTSAKTIKSAAETAHLRYMYAKDGVKTAINNVATKSKQTATTVKNFVAHKAKSAELHYVFGKDALQKKATATTGAVKNGVKQTAQKAKVAGRYTRILGNTKIAPKLIKGATKCAGPVAALYGLYEIKEAYKEGGTNAAVKTAVKVGGGLAGGWAGAKAGAALGSIAGPIGTAVGGIIGAGIGYFLGEKIFS